MSLLKVRDHLGENTIIRVVKVAMSQAVFKISGYIGYQLISVRYRASIISNNISNIWPIYQKDIWVKGKRIDQTCQHA